jgi:hypothetical protein
MLLKTDAGRTQSADAKAADAMAAIFVAQSDQPMQSVTVTATWLYFINSCAIVCHSVSAEQLPP